MSEQCPVTITVHEYYTQNFIAKVAKKECKVSVPGYAGSWIEDVEDVRGMYFVKFQDHEGQHSFNFEPDDKLTVYWLPQPEREEAAAREFADGWRDAEIARLKEAARKLVNSLEHILDTTPSEAPHASMYLDINECRVDYGRYKVALEIDTALATYLRETEDSEPDHK